MSIVVAIVGSDSAVVATDSRCVEPDGSVRDDFRKAFTMEDRHAIGGHSGLLQIRGRPIADLLNELPFDRIRTIDDLAAEAMTLLEESLSNIDPVDVVLEWRKVDVILVARPGLDQRGRPVIRAVVLRPDQSTGRVVGVIRDFACGWCATGDDAAMGSVINQLKCHRPRPGQLPGPRLKALARRLVYLGIATAGTDPRFPTVRTCGGPECVVSL